MPQAWLQRDGMAPELAERLEHLASLPSRVEGLDRARALLGLYDHTRALSRAEDEIARLDDGLLPSSTEGADELDRRRIASTGQQALAALLALESGCDAGDIALAAGIPVDDVDELANRARERDS
jgi:hypothetical protein